MRKEDKTALFYKGPFLNTFLYVKLTGYKRWLDEVHHVGKNVSIKVEHFLFQVFFSSFFYLLCQGIHVRFSTVIWLTPSRCTQSVLLSLTGFGLWKECVRTCHYSHFYRFFLKRVTENICIALVLLYSDFKRFLRNFYNIHRPKAFFQTYFWPNICFPLKFF